MPSKWAGMYMKVRPLYDFSGSVTTNEQWPLGAPSFIHSLGPETVSGPKECMKLGAPSGHCSLVVTDPEKSYKGLTFMYIPAHLDGITWSVYEDMGRMGLSTGGWVYKDVEIPEYCLLGQENRGFYHVMEGFNAARVLVAAACLGGAERALEI